MALTSGPARRFLEGPGRLSLGGCEVQRRGAYQWGVRSTRKPEPPPLDRVYEIPGLEPVTYEGKMHFVPGLARPVFSPWDRGWFHPKFHRSPPIHEQPLYKDQACYIFHQRCRLLEGMKQALWVLEQPVTVQSVGTDGRLFQFLVFQLNTTDLASDAGVKNLVWVDSDQLLYEHFWCRPVIKKKVMVEPVGPVGYQPETFKKFLALYLHGAV
ncbi:PREDICTED: 39S ribosomal protein L37, mitochondrial-like [Elephantulus edwardii]|uniref:39S ribosomal protein L37, mitochondrial-like n=1 Tax=Elephantulus edwardii TaxID=28737 RepID=UPI0003F07ABF|nr:PREDICTED: 39S ribosomal protein L37, mitochondrial-like [Elephantulus edwardii]